MYAKIKMKTHINCINEAKVRADNYIHLQDVLRNEGIENLIHLVIVILINLPVIVILESRQKAKASLNCFDCSR